MRSEDDNAGSGEAMPGSSAHTQRPSSQGATRDELFARGATGSPDEPSVVALHDVLEESVASLDPDLRWRLLLVGGEERVLVRVPRRLLVVLLGRLLHQLHASPEGRTGPLLAASVQGAGDFAELRVSCAAMLRQDGEKLRTEEPHPRASSPAVAVMAHVLSGFGGFVALTTNNGGDTVLRLTLPRVERDSVPPTERPTDRPPARRGVSC